MGALRYLTALVCLAAAAAVVLLTIGAPARRSRGTEEATPVMTRQPVVAEELSRLPTSLETTRRDRGRRLPEPRTRETVPESRADFYIATPASAGTDSRAAGAVAASAPANMSGASAAITIAVTCELDERAFSVTDALQACIDAAPPGSAVEIPRGVYRLDRQVVISTPLTIRTEGSATGGVTCQSAPDRCARLTAGEGFLDAYGLLLVHDTSHVTLEHIVIDGNRRARLSTPAGAACRAGRNTTGFNASVVGCLECALRDFVSTNALCGTAMLWSGAQATIERSDFRNNGQAGTRELLADGLTAIYAPDSMIVNNRFIDNSDVGLILGYGVRTRVEDNDVIQRDHDLFAGIMLDNFTSSDLRRAGDFRGAVVTDNVVDCRPHFCLFGIQLGPRPWFPGVNIVGGAIFENQIHGAKVGINVDGAGTTTAPVKIYSNRVTDVPPGAFANCVNGMSTDWMNIAPTSIVDRSDERTPTGTHLSDTCQFFSAITAPPND